MKYFLITIIISITLVACGGAEERKKAYLEKASFSFEAGDLDKASIDLKNVLQIDPKDAQAYFMLGDIFDIKKEYYKAFTNYSKAVQLTPDNLEYQAKIGAYHLLYEGNIDKATEIKDLILTKDDSNVNGLMLKAMILREQNDSVGAEKIAQDIFSKHPGHVKNALVLSLSYLNEMKFDDSIAVLKACINQNPGNRSLKVALANAYYQDENYEMAEIEYRRILEKNPGVFVNHLMLASFYNAVGKSDKAEAILRNAIKEDADANRMMVLVEFLEQTKGNQSAIVELEKLIDDNKNIGDFRIYLAKLYVAEKNLDEAEKTLKRVILDFPDSEVGIKSRVALAILYMQKSDVDSATKIINDAFEISPNDTEVNFVKAKLLLVKSDYNGAIISLRLVVKDDPENMEAYILLAGAHSANGENEQADEVLDRAFDNNRKNTDVLIALARYYARNKNRGKLEKIIDQYLTIDANNYEALSFKSALLNGRKEFSEAKPYILRLIELFPEKPNGYIQSVPYMLSDDMYSEAVSLLEDGYKKVEKNSSVLETLVSLYITMKNYDAGENIVQNAIRENGETAELYMLLAKIQSSSSNLDGAKKSLLKAVDIKPQWNAPYLVLANIYTADNQNKKAIEILHQGLVEIKSDLKLTLSLAAIYEAIGDYNAAIMEYEKAHEKYVDNVILTNNLAALLVEYRNDENSLKRAKELADRLKSSDQPVILDTVGWVYYKVGDYAEAVSILKIVVDKSPDVPMFNYHLGMALYESGDKATAKDYLEKSLSQDNNFHGKDAAEEYLNKLQ